MPRLMLPVVAAAALAVSTAAALALESNVTKQSSLSPEAVWKKIGDFCGVQDWIPAVQKCVLTHNGEQRTLSLRGGGEVVERLDKWDDANRSYSYTILSSPLPVDDYHATISVAPDAKGSLLNWRSTYKAKGTSDAEAKKTIDGIYEDGSKHLLGG